MSAGRYTSRVFLVGKALRDALAAVTFPPHPTTGKSPAVEFSDVDPSMGAESICVALNVDQTTMDWRRLSPPGRDETITFDVVARSLVPNVKTSAAVWDRLEEISGVLESVVYDTATESVIQLPVPGLILAGLVGSVRPSVWPSSDGWQGAVVVSYSFTACI